MVTKDNGVYCNICGIHMGNIVDGEFLAFPKIHEGGFLRLQVHDMHSVLVVYECDYCPPCSNRVSPMMREINIVSGRIDQTSEVKTQ